MVLYSPGGLNLADTTAPLILAYDNSGTSDVVFAVSSSGDLTITPDGNDVFVKGTSVDFHLQSAASSQVLRFVWTNQVDAEIASIESNTGIGSLIFNPFGSAAALTLAATTGAATFTGATTLTGVTALLSDTSIAATGRFYFDGSGGVGSDTYIFESVANVLTITAGGTAAFRIKAAQVGIPALAKFYLDGVDGGDTYIFEGAANRIQMVCGGSVKMDANASTGTTGLTNNDVYITAAKRFYVDGGGDTYVKESSANVVTWTVGGVDLVRFHATSLEMQGTLPLIVAPTGKVFFDGGVHTYIVENSANVLRCVAGGSGGVDLLSGGTSWTAVSDERLKTIIEPIEGALEGVGKLRSVIGRYKTDDISRRRSFLIAQDVQKVLPEAVTVGEDGTLNLSYTDVIPLLVAAINELEAKVA